MSDLFDLDALAAEADGKEPFRFQFGGEAYELPSELDIRGTAALSSGRVYEGLQMLLGDEQWQRMQDADAVLTDRMLGALFEAYAEHAGLSLGESSASTDSSRSTVRPSKRTSNGTTRRR
jgi:hypothetical protein